MDGAAAAGQTQTQATPSPLVAFFASLQELPDRLYEGSMDMAVTFRDKINKYADLVSGKNNDHTKETEYVMLENKKTLDGLWRHDRWLYDVLLKLSRSGTTVLNDYQLTVLRQMILVKKRSK